MKRARSASAEAAAVGSVAARMSAYRSRNAKSASAGGVALREGRCRALQLQGRLGERSLQRVCKRRCRPTDGFDSGII